MYMLCACVCVLLFACVCMHTVFMVYVCVRACSCVGLCVRVSMPCIDTSRYSEASLLV